MSLLPELRRELCVLLGRLRDGELDEAQLAQLDELVGGNADARRLYLDYVDLCASLHWARRDRDQRRGAGDEGRGMAGSPAIDLPVVAAVELPHQLDFEPQIPEPPFPPLSTTHYPLPTSDFVGSWAFSYMVATVIMGVAILGFWAYKITHHQHIAEAPSQSVPSEAMPEMVFVGRITGMVDAKWSDDPRYSPPPGYARVSLGRKYILDSGLMEITYDSGAKVILEGPCTYEVESTAGGYLSLGKLTARVGGDKETRRQGDKEKKADAVSPYLPVSPSPGLPASPLFSVRTPTALITDLGTEFGVEVAEDGTGEVHVLQGEVVTRSLIAGEGDDASVHLKAGQAVRIEPNSGKFTAVKFASKGFVCNLRTEVGRKIEAAYIRGVLADEPLAYWPLNEPAQARRFMDRSGNGFHGRAVGEVRSGRPGPLSSKSCSVEFDGQGYIDVGRQDRFSLVNGFTVEAWILAEHSTNPTRVISADNAVPDSTMRIGWSLMHAVEPHNTFANGFPCFVFTAHGVEDAAFNTVVTPTSRWIHVAVVFDRNNIAHLFQNGRPRSSVDVGGPAKVGPAWLSIGAMSNKGQFWKGRLAHVAVYPQELSEEQILRHLHLLLHPTSREPEETTGNETNDVNIDNER